MAFPISNGLAASDMHEAFVTIKKLSLPILVWLTSSSFEFVIHGKYAKNILYTFIFKSDCELFKTSHLLLSKI